MIDLLHKAFADHFPIKSELVELDYVEIDNRGNNEYGVVVRLLQWDRGETELRIRDVKEQSVHVPIATIDLATIVRLRELLAAMAKVLPEVLAHPDVERSLPHELIDFSPLRTKAATLDEFVALLHKRWRGWSS